MSLHRKLSSYAGRIRATSRSRRDGTSDTLRWSQPDSLAVGWDERVRHLAEFIPADSRVIEFGAGHMALRRFLPTGCTYTATDLVARDDQCEVYDLNADRLQPITNQDVAFLSGVLEYVHDVPRCIDHLTACGVSTWVLSYAARDRSWWRLRVIRRALGWVNDYSTAELEALFSSRGFRLDATKIWKGQRLYRWTAESGSGS